MRTEIRAVDFPITEAIREHAAHRLSFAVRGFRRRISSVWVWLRSEGPNATTCRVVARTRCGNELVMEDRAGDLYSAIDLACDKASTRLGRWADRQLEDRRRRRSSSLTAAFNPS